MTYLPGPSPKIKRLDIVLLAGVAALAVTLIFRIHNSLDYRWNWAVIPQYLLRFDEASRQWVPGLLLEGLFTTLRLSVWSMLLALLLGLTMGLFRTSPSLFKRLVGQTYVGLVRNLPPLVMIFLFYFFLSSQVTPLFSGLPAFLGEHPRISRWVGILLAPPEFLEQFLSATLTLALIEGAYITEIVRSGIQSIERGQWDAARALGLSYRQQLQDIVLPQAFQRMLPPLAGQFISTVKDSAIVSVISIQELTFQGSELMATTYLTLEVWITITLMYLLLTLSLSLGARQLERHLRNRV
ncbi:MAG: amino acid ABC transporter permease [Desulfuromonadales bacterium]|uniref:amino acid ABC transporter permease n=1 Tax=Desulfuromonas sp. KJ2020 TaxID=2919173 RepID=UPI0020A7D9B7|nr:amino acid ABC transporter permease [Desulfuromonas sp. KJ2020]MCP3176631.1 amino acid ABC transporter permease [Desulfuromonas sp. KJ2020]